MQKCNHHLHDSLFLRTIRINRQRKSLLHLESTIMAIRVIIVGQMLVIHTHKPEWEYNSPTLDT